MSFVIDKNRLRGMLRDAEEHRPNWHWMKCPLCLGYSVFESFEDQLEFQKHGYCRCGHKYTHNNKTGLFPRGRVFIWDEEEVKDELCGDLSGVRGTEICADGEGGHISVCAL